MQIGIDLVQIIRVERLLKDKSALLKIFNEFFIFHFFLNLL